MDLQLVARGLDYTQKRRKWVLLAAALGFSGYSAYRVYQSPSVIQKRKKLLRVLGALISVAEAVGDTAEAIGVVSNGLKEFVKSDSDQVPNSLRQLGKIARSDEFSGSVIKITRALSVGILQGYGHEARKGSSISGNSSKGSSISGNSSFPDRVLDKLFSTAGSGFASVVVGSFARNLVMAFYSDKQRGGRIDFNSSLNSDHSVEKSDSLLRFVDVICDEKSRELIRDCIQMFVSTAVAAYLDKTMDVNIYEELFSGLTNPKHETKVKDMLALVCNGAVETLVRTSHQVLTNPNSKVHSKCNSSYLDLDLGENGNNLKYKFDGQEVSPVNLKARKSFDENQDSGWASKMSSTLAVPRNRRLVLDLTGRVTFETVRSFLDFLLERLSLSLKRNLNVVQEEVVDMGVQFYRKLTAKSTTVVTICLSLCLHILNGPWILVPP